MIVPQVNYRHKTPEDLAREAIAPWAPVLMLTEEQEKEIVEAIRKTIVRAGNEEVERRRGLEAQLAGIQSGVVVCVGEKDVRLKVWNPFTKCFWETSLIKSGGWREDV